MPAILASHGTVATQGEFHREALMDKRIPASMIVAFACSGAVLAQGLPPATVKSAPAAHGQFLYRTSAIVGADVRDPQERKVGKIKDLILGSVRGDIAYAVVMFDGIGARTKYHAIPWKALQPADGRYYILHADRETISGAPGFDRGKWPDLTERSWSEEVDRYWSRRVGQGMADSNRLPPERSSGTSGGTTGSSGSGQ
jgi:hypothetical protein